MYFTLSRISFIRIPLIPSAVKSCAMDEDFGDDDTAQADGRSTDRQTDRQTDAGTDYYLSRKA